MGELHLDIIKTKLIRDMKINVNVGRPRVAYRETITKSADARGLHKKQSGGRGQFGDAIIKIEPITAEEAEEAGLKYVDGMVFVDEIFGGSIPKEYIPSVEYGCRQALKTGIVGGFPMINVKISLVDGSYHDVDSSQVAFEQAGILAFREGARKAGPQLLEPVMKVMVTTPEEFLGAVTGDLNRRRALIVDQQQRANTRVIEAEVPLSEMFGYATIIRSLTQGRASYSMEPLDYRPVPDNIAKSVVEGQED